MTAGRIATKIIHYSFYLLFLIVPLLFTSATSELFEFNKMWATFVLTTIIVASWIIKMTTQKRFFFQRTFLDIPLLFFLASQIISTIFSLDSYVSWWGYYSRFNGGLLSTICYIALYYAFISNVDMKYVRKCIYISIFSGTIVSLWGLPSHFGYDPTCFIFRGNFDVSCWTNAFQPKLRIFSTLGQPDWLAAYLAILIPIVFSVSITTFKKQKIILSLFLSFLGFLFYIDLLYTRARSGFIAIVCALIFFSLGYIIIKKNYVKTTSLKELKTTNRYVLGLVVSIICITFFIGQPIAQLDKFTYKGLINLSTSKGAHRLPTPKKTDILTQEITDSGNIRLLVWQGALDAWKAHPFFGTGVETFAFAYYQYRPSAHNLTSEWDYLYNKAHNEYLNFLTTTGLVGLGSYLMIIGAFLFVAIKNLLTQRKSFETDMIQLALIGGFISILITNFFGFSVVMTNVYLFLIPAFVLALQEKLFLHKQFSLPKLSLNEKTTYSKMDYWQWLCMCVVIISVYIIISTLYRYWIADQAYGLGQNLDRANQYQQAYPLLHTAVDQKPEESVFQDELSLNDTILAVALASENRGTDAATLAQEAIQTSNTIIANHPNNVTFWKTRIKVFNLLSQLNSAYLPITLEAAVNAQKLAPTDAKISYTLGVLYGQSNKTDMAIETLQRTIKLRPNYKDAYYALGLFLHDSAIDEKGKIIHVELQEKAIDTMNYILRHFDPNDKQAKESVNEWNK